MTLSGSSTLWTSVSPPAKHKNWTSHQMSSFQIVLSSSALGQSFPAVCHSPLISVAHGARGHLHFLSLPVLYKWHFLCIMTEQLGKHWLQGVECMGLSCIVSQHMEALCKFLKAFPSYYCHLLESCSISNYENGTRRWALPLTGVKQLTFAQPLIGLMGLHGTLGFSLPQPFCFMCCIYWSSL